MTIVPRLLIQFSLLLCSLLMLGATHAQDGVGGCPPGQIPHSGTDISSCGPIPEGYSQQPTQPQLPPPQQWQDHWGAIVTDPVKSILGTAVDKISQSQAEQAAFADCQAKGGTACKLDIAYRNQCAAMVAGATGYNTKAGATINDAVQTAMKVCSAATGNCRAYYTACSLPVRIQ